MNHQPPDNAPWPTDDGEPVFSEPWEAQAFGLAVHLSDAGAFTWPEWAAVLGEEIEAAKQRGESDTSEHYYHHWLRALQRICREKGLASDAEVDARKEQWRQAYLHTPHGHPVELSAAEE